MIKKEIENIEEADIQHLIDEQNIESKTLEYKSILPGNLNSDKREFKADISSFANASGGDIIYGVKEDKGAPLSPLEGIPIEDIDKENARGNQNQPPDVRKTGNPTRLETIVEAGGDHLVRIGNPCRGE